ncbi:hypothetical protein ACFXK0_28945 [Nocardia sp. NPDC059177]|uniref:hypothetical protein n=1 Tax=Nocardia sp. NPDC059177 TaxID=3346759 RepID=UPI0036C16D8E
MGSKTVEGYAIPEDKNPMGVSPELVFPYEQAATLVTAAAKVGNSMVKAQVELIRKMLGNPSDVSTVLAAWQKAVSELTQSIDGSDDGNGLVTAKASLEARWTGTSGEAAAKYLQHIIEVTPLNATIIAGMAEQINTFGALVLKNYGTCIRYITEYAATVARASASLMEEIKEMITLDGGSAETAIINALADFMELTGKLTDEVIEYKKEIGGTLDTLITQAGTVQVPSNIAPDALILGGYQPRNPTGKPWGNDS